MIVEADRRAAQTSEEGSAYANSEVAQMIKESNEVKRTCGAKAFARSGACKPSAQRRSRAHAQAAERGAARRRAEEVEPSESDFELPLSQLVAGATSSAVESAARTQDSSAGVDTADAAASTGVLAGILKQACQKAHCPRCT